MFPASEKHQGVTLMRKLLLAVVLAAPLLASACNTIAGLGKDVGIVGGAVEKTAEDAK
jgi:predicted small secreted protein